jgi:hypothetical protein
MSTTIKLRRDTAANWTAANPTLALGEPGIETDTRKIKYGDGVTAWTTLQYAVGSTSYTGTITSVAGSGTVKGLTLSGSGTSGSVTLTLGGNLSLAQTDITTALGYTPLQSSSLSVSTAAASGSGSLSYTGGVFTFTPPVIGSYSLPTASTSVLGGVKIDGSTITLNGSNQLVANYTNYTLPTASTTVLGGVKVDGSTVTINGSGVITATVAGLTYGSRATVATTTAVIANAASATATVTMGKGYVLYQIDVSNGAWVTVYSSSSAQSADSSRTITTDPTPGSGVIAEAITTSAGTASTAFTPAVFGYNNDGTVSTNAYLKIYNNSGASHAITVTLTFLRLE